MKTSGTLLTLFALIVCNFLTFAQEPQWDDEEPELYQVEFFLFEDDKTDEAKTIIENYFNAASLLAGMPAPFLKMDLNSWDYNYMVVWAFSEGEENLIWQTCPTNSDWYQAFVEVAGSEEKAKAIIEEFDSCVTASKTELAYIE